MRMSREGLVNGSGITEFVGIQFFQEVFFFLVSLLFGPLDREPEAVQQTEYISVVSAVIIAAPSHHMYTQNSNVCIFQQHLVALTLPRSVVVI